MKRLRPFKLEQRPAAGPRAFVRLLKADADLFCARVRSNAQVLLMPGSVYDDDQRHVRFGFGRKNCASALTALADAWPTLI